MLESMDQEATECPLQYLPEAFVELSLAMLTEPDTESQRVAEFIALLHHSAELAEAEAYLGLPEICALLAGQLAHFALQAEPLSDDLVGACADWATLLQEYLQQQHLQQHLQEPGFGASNQALLDYLCQPCWGLGIEPSEAGELLQAVGFGVGEVPEQLSQGTDTGAATEYLTSLSELQDLTLDSTHDERELARMSVFADDTSDEVLAKFGVADELSVEPFTGAMDVEIDPAWAELESLVEDSAQCDDGLLADVEPAALAEALASMAGDAAFAAADSPTARIGLEDGEATSAAGDVSLSQLEGLLSAEEKGADSLEAFADALVAEELAPVTAPVIADDNASGLSDAVTQLLAILLAELPQIEVALHEWLGLLAAPEVEKDIQAEACGSTRALFGRLQMASESMGLTGLCRVCEGTMANLAALDAEQDQSYWVEILPLLRSYLSEPLCRNVAEQLVMFLSHQRLPVPLTASQAGQLLRALSEPDFSQFEEEFVERLQQASTEHVSLVVGDDVSPELLDGLLQELPQYSEEFSLALQRLINDGAIDAVNDAQRIAHTIKGAGNVVGIRGVAELTHHLEDILIVLAKSEALPCSALADSLLKAADCLEAMSDTLQGFSSAPDNAQQVLQEVLDWANLIDRDGPSALHTPAVAVATADIGAAAKASTRVAPVVPLPAPVEAVAADTPTLPASTGTAESHSEGATATLRVSAELVDDLLRLVGEATILNAQLRERVQKTQDRALLLEAQFDSIHQLGTELEELVDIKDFSRHRDVDDDFDALEMDQYNELHSYSRRMIEAAVDAKEMGREILGELDSLDDMIVSQGQLNSETHEGVLKTRMVPVDSVFARLQRCVRQTCRTTGKPVDLVLSGGDTLMDSEVLRDVVDPVMHLLRNAIDHGIEAAESRSLAGKHLKGKLELSFTRDGNHIRVRCKDDGAGLDYAAIRLAAVRDGLLDEGDDVADDELKRMVLRPNFTTRSTVTQVSGRGIGLNAVYGQVLGLKGSLQLDSVRGEGCTMDIRLPVTLLSTHALLVQVDGQTYALASRGIERIVHVDDGAFADFGGARVYQLDQQPYRVSRLANVLGLEASAVDVDAPGGMVILMEVDDRTEAVVVDEVVGSRELVVKPLGRYMPKLNGIVGATILGDGQVSPVLDLVEMLRQPIAYEQVSSQAYSLASSDAGGSQPVAFVVDDSLSARRALAQLLGDAGYTVQTARDGLEAVDLLSAGRPDIIFVDMEMPRMNGIELTSHIRSRGGLEQLPVVMITSRSTEKHRRQAADAGVDLYLTKPFSDDQLIEQIETLTANVA
ncbi:hypothetical protein A9Q89_01730 [Gammaproteobacteria bacterium 53_120_T64]|nr:hypothetical protein A9Q89_01730 [Gammaproteobacteria bacterium 53_120_T64]